MKIEDLENEADLDSDSGVTGITKQENPGWQKFVVYPDNIRNS